MCGKFTQLASWQEVHAFSQPLVEKVPADEVVTSTPMRFAKVMRLNADGACELAPMRWGFADRNSATPLQRPKQMHARAETIDKLPTFRQAFSGRRGILMVHTFNEGEEVGGRTKQWTITPNDGQPIAIAVIWEQWINGPEVLDTFVQVTVPANTLISRITDRMPAILLQADWPTWLGETGASPADVKSLLRTFEDGGNWRMAEQQPARSAARPKASRQERLF